MSAKTIALIIVGFFSFVGVMTILSWIDDALTESARKYWRKYHE